MSEPIANIREMLGKCTYDELITLYASHLYLVSRMEVDMKAAANEVISYQGQLSGLEVVKQLVAEIKRLEAQFNR